MLKCSDLIGVMNMLAPEKLAESWDNSGLIIGRRDSAVTKVLVSLDYTKATLEEAVFKGCEMVITHHPPVFSKMSKVNDQSFVGSLILDTAKAGVSVYSAHTNLDYASGGTCDKLAEILELQDVEGFMPPNEYGESLGRVGHLKEKLSLEEFAGVIKKKLNAEHMVFVGDEKAVIERVALVTGSASKNEYFNQALVKNADVYISGDLSYHHALDALAMGLNVIDATHYATEFIVCETIVEHLCKNQSEAEVFIAKSMKPVFCYI